MEQQLAAPGWRAGKDALHPLEHLNCFTGSTLARLAARVGLAAAPEPAALRADCGAALLGALRAGRAEGFGHHPLLRAGGGVAMCGILGQIESQRRDRPAAFARMLATLAARGPDGEGTRVLRQGRVALGHRRLAILDLSDERAPSR